MLIKDIKILLLIVFNNNHSYFFDKFYNETNNT